MVVRCAVVAGMLFALAGCQAQSGPEIPAPGLGPPRIGGSDVPQQPAPAQRDAWAPAVPMRPWLYIVIHHSDTDRGSAASFDRYHREVNGWDSLGYHFVIGNGHGSPDGYIEAGPRWVRQQTGAHAGVKLYNERGIGICLVGNFQTDHPTPAQLRSLARLNAYLMRTCGIPASRIIGHNTAKAGRTNCPGRHLSIDLVRQMASGHADVADPEPLAAGDLFEPIE